MQIVISAVVVLGVFVVAPIWFVFSLRRMSLGDFMYGPQGKRKSTAAMGSALRELDRLVARPSIEYRIEAEDPDKLVEDEKGGE
ncbi:MAG TPA: hypothetical protein VGJ04_11570 [Pirellulales bacterium]